MDGVEFLAQVKDISPDSVRMILTGQALDEITKNRGILYDPEVVDECPAVFHEKSFAF